MLYFHRTIFPAWLRIYIYPHNKRDVRVYIYIYIYITDILHFPCWQDLARLKIRLNILAHVPKSLLDPGIDATYHLDA